MKLKKLYFIVILSVAALLITSCDSYQKMVKSQNYDKLYETAIRYYNKGQYYKCMQLFDQLILPFRGKEQAERIAYYYAYAAYKTEDYLTASYYFKSYVKSYPSSVHAEECMYMNALSKVKESPIYSLDQTATKEALKELQTFINLYPNSIRVAEANQMIDEMRYKLSHKAYENALLYYKTEEFRAAIISFQNVLKDYPEIKEREQAMLYVIKAGYLYAQGSLEAKKRERFEFVVTYFDKISTNITTPKILKEAQGYRDLALKEVTKRAL